MPLTQAVSSTHYEKPRSSSTANINSILNDAKRLLVRLKNRNCDYPELTTSSPALLSKQSHAAFANASKDSWSSDQSSGQAFLVSNGFDVPKFESNFNQFKAPAPSVAQPDALAVIPSKSSKTDLTLPKKKQMSTDEYFKAKREVILGELYSSNDSKKSFDTWFDNAFVEQWALFKDTCSKAPTFDITALKANLQPERKQNILGSEPLVKLLDISCEKLSLKRKVYGEVVQSLVLDQCRSSLKNHDSASTAYYPICASFYKASGSTKLGTDFDMRSMREVWKFLMILTDEDRKVMEREPRSVPSTTKDPQITHIKPALRFLEKSYIEYMDKTIHQFPKEAMLGGRPSLLDKVRAYLNIKFGGSNKMLSLPKDAMQNVCLVQGLPVWATLFYLIRCGDWNSALAFVQSNSNIFYRLDNNFLMFLEHAVEALKKQNVSLNLSGGSFGLLEKEYKNLRAAEASNDPYRVLIYELLYRKTSVDRISLEDEPFTSILAISSIEDWLWYQLSLSLPLASQPVGLGKSHSNSPNFLKKFQDSIIELGPQYFMQDEKDPFIYFKILLLAGLYDSACSYLFYFQDYQFAIEALHVAIVLLYARIIDVKKKDAPLAATNDSFDFIQMLTICSKDISRTMPIIGFYYCILLALCGDFEQEMAVALKDWTIQTTEISFAFGTMDNNGLYHGGELIKFESLYSGNLRERVAVLAGDELEEQGKALDSLTFYHMANRRDKVLAILCKTVSESLTQFYYSPSPSVFSCIQNAKAIMEFYTTSTKSLSHSEASTSDLWMARLQKLLCLFDALSAFHSKNYEMVLVKLQEGGLWPQPSSELEEFSEHHEIIQMWKTCNCLLLSRHVPRMLQIYVLTVKELFMQLSQPKTSLFQSHNQIMKRLGELKKASRFTIFALASLHVPSEIYDQLASIDASLETFF